jgi:hypothetical protein
VPAAHHGDAVADAGQVQVEVEPTRLGEAAVQTLRDTQDTSQKVS